jgi:imidazolonepropionase-like amidohydrolase
VGVDIESDIDIGIDIDGGMESDIDCDCDCDCDCDIDCDCDCDCDIDCDCDCDCDCDIDCDIDIAIDIAPTDTDPDTAIAAPTDPLPRPARTAAMRLLLLLAVPASLLLPACAATTPHAAPGVTVLRNAVVDGQPADLWLEGGRIVSVESREPAAADTVVDLDGAWVVPAFIDSHVHLAYRPRPEALADGGIAAGVDLAAPRAFLADPDGPVRVVASGPMITAPGGYPTQSWGAGGYGWEVATPDEARTAAAALVDEGAGVLKIPFGHGPVLDDATLTAAIDAAHDRGLLVAAHALSAAEASRAATFGADVLAHTPGELLPPEVVAQWSGRAVVSTLRAFGASGTMLANLTALHAAGCEVLYGTDYGNSAVDGIDAAELQLLQDAGLTPDEVLAAATARPAARWGLTDLGRLQPGAAASFLVLDGDPRNDWSLLASPRQVWLDGAPR